MMDFKRFQMCQRVWGFDELFKDEPHTARVKRGGSNGRGIATVWLASLPR